MKISELKQPYRRMAEYLAKSDDKNDLLSAAFIWEDTDDLVWRRLYYGIYSPITEEIKTHFPADFDFSVEEESLNEKYTQLAKEGKFDELPDTCEFSEPVELEVWEDELSRDFRKITGKFKGNYMDIHCIGWIFAKLPTKKIDFSDFKTGDVVEVVKNDNEHIYGLLWQQDEDDLNLTFSNESDKSKYILKKDIKSITKIK